MRTSIKGLVLLAGLLATGVALAHDAHPAAPMSAHCAQPDPVCSPTVTVALDAQGKLWRAFVNDRTLYVQQRLADGSFARPLRVNRRPEAVSTQGESRLQLAIGKAGQMYLAWVVKVAGSHTSHIRFARSTSAAGHFSKAVTIDHDPHDAMHNFPALAVNERGQVFLAWLDMRDTAMALAAGKPADHGVTAAVFYNWSDDGGAHFRQQDLRVKSRACLCCRLAMTLDTQGLPVLLFRDVYPGNERDHSLVGFDSVSQPGAAVRVSDGHWQLDGCPEKGPALLQTAQRLHLVWFDRNQLFYRHRDAQGLSAVQPLGRPGSARGTLASANGVLYLAWQRYSDGAMRVYVQRSVDGGDHFDEPREVAATRDASDYPELVGDGHQVWLSWLTREQGHQLMRLDDGTPEQATQEPEQAAGKATP